MPELSPEPIADAIARGDSALRFACSGGRENGPYDLDGFAIERGDERISPIRIAVDGQTIIATFADPLQPGDEVAS